MNADKFKIGAIKKGADKNLLDQAPGPQKKTKGVGGRPRKSDEDKLTESLTIYLKKSEMENLKELSEQNFGVSLAKLVRGLLQQYKVI